MDHVKKLVYTIVGCLTIVSLTFTICTKIGHCEDLGIVGLPLIYGQGQGFDSIVFTENHMRQINAIYAQNPSNGPMEVMLFGEYTDSTHYTVIGLNKYANGYDVQFENVTPDNAFPNLQYRCPARWVIWTISGDNVSYVRYGDSIDIWINNFVELGNNGYYDLKSGNLYKYPMWTAESYNGEIYDTDGNLIFSRTIPVPVPGHTKGGVLSNYIDSQDFLGNLPEVDEDPPSDTSSIPGWLNKILGGLGTINKSIQSGVLTIGDYIGQLKESVENGIAWVTQPYDSQIINDNVAPFLSDNALIQGFNSSKTSIQGVYSAIGSVSAKTRSQMVWDIPFNLPSMSQTFHAQIDFGWYENIRSTFEPFLNMFLMVGFLFSFIRSIPGILHGNSGEGDT